MGNLTALKVRSIKEPGRYSDGNGLILICKASGAKSWILRIQYRGKRHDIGLGGVSELTLAQARDRAHELRKAVREGRDPIAERKLAASGGPQLHTFREEALAFFQERSPNWSNEKHRAQWLSTMETYVYPTIGDQPIEKVTGPDVRALLVPIWQDKPETARRVLQRITTVLDYAHSKGLREHEAPLRSIRAGLGKQIKRASHFAAMPYAQAPELFASIHSSETTGKLALAFALLTAARSGEVRGATWGEIDLKSRLWCVPAERMKARREHTVPLSDQALAVLKLASELRHSTSPQEHIFRGVRGGALSDMTLTKALRSEVQQKWTVHGFRSTFRDWAAEKTSFPSAAVETALAHTIANKTEAAYHRTDYLDIRRQIMDDWAQFLSASSGCK